MTTNRTGFAVFETAIGQCALVWRGASICGAALPENDSDGLRARLKRRFPEAEERDAPPTVRDAVALVRRLLDGERVDLSPIPLDLAGHAAFDRTVWRAAATIRCGEIRSYGEIAKAIGQPGAGRAVGAALGRNPVPVIIPCHRVLGSHGRGGGFSALGGAATKFRLLAIEGAQRKADPMLFGTLPLAIAP